MTARVPRVLLVEDNEDNRGIIRQVAEMMEFELIEAGNGLEGVERAQADRPDLIVLDLSLPVLDGWEAARRLKADARTASIPIVALTAHAMAGDEARARQAGCDGYVTKPLDIARFQALLDGYLRGEGP